jgi:hypothetical protein
VSETRDVNGDSAKAAVPARPTRPAFETFFERDALRQKRKAGRRRTLVLSVLVHVVALGSLVVYTVWHVDELFGPSVEVKMFRPSAVPGAPPAPASPAPPAP